MKNFVAATAILMLVASTLEALSASQGGPYRVAGKPVPSSCLSTLGNGDSSRLNPINLSHCGDPAMKPKTLPTGMIGFDDPQGGYFYYRYLGQLDGLDILYLEHSGGGTGEFTDLVGIKQEGRILQPVRDYGGGDRCNGGLSNISFVNGILTFDQAITPYDLIALADPKTDLEADKDLEASASSCIGSSHMVTDDKHWIGVRLTEKDRADQPGWTENYRYQACFNQLYRDDMANGRAELDHDAVMAFADRFVERCVRSKS